MIAAAALALGSSAAFAQQAPIDRAAPRQAGVRPAPSTLEGGLWALSDRMEKQIQTSGQVLKDKALEAYVSDLACRLAGAHCTDLRVYILDAPVWNAFMAPNGTMAVYSGLMLRMDDEAELACVIGHESGHFIQNHSLENFMAVKNRSNIAMALGIGAAAAGAPSSAQQVVQLATMASLMRYSRQHEAEADTIGVTKVQGSGLDPRACARVWRNLLAEFEASDQRALRRRASGETGLLDSHPGASVRADALEAAAKSAPDDLDLGRARYRAAIRPHLLDWLRADLRQKDFGAALHFLERRLAEGEDVGVYEFMRGEAYRLRRKEGDLARAAEAYGRAIQAPDAPAEAWREIGYIALRDNDKLRARTMLETYLQRAPNAGDRALVNADIAKLMEHRP
jgi:predicted Zn-dependent protease